MKKSSPTEIGRAGESMAVQYLASIGYVLIEQNWRTPFCEIDIVASKNSVVYMIEVKLRNSSYGGDGLDAITDKKLRQMRRAAEAWASYHKYDGDYQLGAVGINGIGELDLVLIEE